MRRMRRREEPRARFNDGEKEQRCHRIGESIFHDMLDDLEELL